VTDQLTERYGNLLQGSYDCVDRIVLNAYNSVCHSAGGFRQWWRRAEHPAAAALAGSPRRIRDNYAPRALGVRGQIEAFADSETYGIGRHGQQRHDSSAASISAT